MTDDELMDIAKPLAADGGRWPSDLLSAMHAAAAAEHEACVKACEAAADTGDDRGVERDVVVWNKAVAYCVRRLKERSNAESGAAKPSRWIDRLGAKQETT